MYRMLEAGDVVEASDEVWDASEGHWGKWVPVPDDNVGRTIDEQGSRVPARRKISDPLADLMPFTPNKYTRQIPTLDGRTVPVDVYCVLAAFPTGSSAIDHAVKKLLAPGARGVKSRKQDIQEAVASLNRALDLEADAP